MPILLIVVGVVSGIASGLFGIGGGVIVVPALTVLLGYTHERAIGTSLAVLLPPVGLAAVMQYYRQGNVDLRGAAWIAGGLFAGAWLGSLLALRSGETAMRMAFGIFVTGLGVWLTVAAARGIQPHAL
jgi:uncharacterized membrane protein YfcA